MKRREFIALFSCATVARPLPLSAQQPSKVPTIGFLGPTTSSAQGRHVTAFVQRLDELGWIEGRTISIEYRWAEGRSQRFVEIAAEFVRLKVDVIVTQNTPAVLAAKEATSVIPIVFATAGDPVGTGMIASLARPGGNVTGLSSQGGDTVGKRAELLREVAPSLRRLAILGNMGNRYSVLEIGRARDAARTLGFEVTIFHVQQANEIVSVLQAHKGNATTLYVCADPLLFNSRTQINTLALPAGWPTIYAFPDYLEAGGLMSYGVDFADQFRRAADHVDKILQGAKPADMPVQ